jgi:hypothetical protein
MRATLDEVAGILQQRRLRGRRAGCAPRHAAKHGDAFGHQVGVGLEFGGHGGEEGLQLEDVCALDRPHGLFDVRA